MTKVVKISGLSGKIVRALMQRCPNSVNQLPEALEGLPILIIGIREFVLFTNTRETRNMVREDANYGVFFNA